MSDKKSIRLSKKNQGDISKAIEGTLVSANKAGNEAIQFGMPKLLKKLGKNTKTP